MVNDVLEQIAEDYFRDLGYFTQHNIRYRPNIKGPAYAVHSDIDILGIHPHKKGIERVIVVNCKSWQGGLNIGPYLKVLNSKSGSLRREQSIRRTFQDLLSREWTKALSDKVYELTGQKEFILYLALTKYKGDKKLWENFKHFTKNFPNCRIEIIDLETMILKIQEILTTTPAHSELSRLMQLIKAGNGKIEYKK